jgi:hypothetical protein
LAWSPSLAILALALVTGGLLVIIRRLSTDQALLRQAAADGRRLKQLIREARRRKDAESVHRHRRVAAGVGMIKLKAEWRPLAILVIPIAVLATWAYQRLEFQVPRVGEPLEVRLVMPLSAAGEVTHLVPAEGLVARDGWVRTVTVVREVQGRMARVLAWLTRGRKGVPPPRALARWTVTPERDTGPWVLDFRYRDKTFSATLEAGGTTYTPAVLLLDEDVRLEFGYRENRLLGWVPGLPSMMLPAWLVGYLLLTIPLAMVLKRLAGVW